MIFLYNEKRGCDTMDEGDGLVINLRRYDSSKALKIRRMREMDLLDGAEFLH